MSGVELREADWNDPDGVALRSAMEAEMRERYADRIAAFMSEHAVVIGVHEEHVAHVLLAYEGPLPVGHAALRWTGGDLELKRMYVVPSHRGHGVSTALLDGVAKAAEKLGATRIILQTGDRQPDAVRLYERAGYTGIPIFPPYEALTFSICMERRL